MPPDDIRDSIKASIKLLELLGPTRPTVVKCTEAFLREAYARVKHPPAV
jgi:hypothetical protein